MIYPRRRVTVSCDDAETFAGVYIDLEKATSLCVAPFTVNQG
jgi:hypothetical protein